MISKIINKLRIILVGTAETELVQRYGIHSTEYHAKHQCQGLKDQDLSLIYFSDDNEWWVQSGGDDGDISTNSDIPEFEYCPCCGKRLVGDE